MMIKLDFSVVVPVYRGENTIARLFDDCSRHFTETGQSFEVIFVCDGAKDQSWKAIEQLAAQHPRHVKGILLTRNFGQHNALLCGFKHSQGKFIITMDEDLQHSASDISQLVKKQEEQNYDVVYGVYHERKHNLFRNFTSGLLRKMISWGIRDIHPDYSAFRLLKSDIAVKIAGMESSYTFVDGYLSWITTHAGSTTVTHSAGMAGKSSYTFQKLLDHSINIFITFSYVPIRMLSWFSIISFLLSGGYGIYNLFRKLLFDDLISGFASVAVMSGLGLGFILLGMGILGEYVYRINLKTTRRPMYEVREITEV